MKVRSLAFAAVLILTAGIGWAQTDANKALEQFKSMVGVWTSSSGDSVTYQLAAGGTAVMADMKMHGEAMASMIYLDGSRLMLTHFCPSGNQPRMQATISPDLKTISFDFLDATNLPNPQVGHMHRAVYVFISPDHYKEDWTWRQDGKDAHMLMDLQRKK